MSEKWFDKQSQLLKFMQEELKFTEESAEDAFDNLVEEEEEQDKRQTRIYGWLYNEDNDVYYQLTYLNDYDWGNNDFTIFTTPCKLYKETKIVETTVNVFKPVTKEK